MSREVENSQRYERRLQVRLNARELLKLGELSAITGIPKTQVAAICIRASLESAILDEMIVALWRNGLLNEEQRRRIWENWTGLDFLGPEHAEEKAKNGKH